MDIDRHIGKAEEALQRKNPDFAIGVCRQILGIDPGNAKARACLRKASLMKTKGKGAPAVVRTLANLPSLVQMRLLTTLRKPEGVLKTCDRILVKDPNNTRVSILAGETALELGYDDAAIQIFESLGKDGGGDPQALKALGSLYRQKGEIQKALDCYEQALKLDPRDNEALRARKNLAAEEALTTKGYETAGSSRELMKDKEQARELERSARIARTPAEIQESIDRIEKGDADLTDPRTREDLADLYRKKEDYSKALELLEAVQEARPDDQDLANRIGDLTILEMDQEIRELRTKAGDAAAKQRLQRLEERKARFLVEEYGRRVKLHPTDLRLRHLHGKSLMDAGQIDEAIAEFQKAVNDPKSRIEALSFLGNCFARKKMYDLASKQLGLAIEGSSDADRKTLELRYRLGRVLEENEETEKALAEYSRIFERDINFRDVAAKIAALRATKGA